MGSCASVGETIPKRTSPDIINCFISIVCFTLKRGRAISRQDGLRLNLYNNTRIHAQGRLAPSLILPKTKLASHTLTSRAFNFSSCKGWSSDFPPLPSAFSSNCLMAFLLRSHNGVHCCGTVGDSHSSSQLIAAKRTFMGDSFLNHDAKVMLFSESRCVFLRKNCMFIK